MSLRATSKPLRSGSETSSRTSSGSSCSTSATPDDPSEASPMTSKPSSSSIARAEARKCSWSSTMTTVFGMCESSCIARTIASDESLVEEAAEHQQRADGEEREGPGDRAQRRQVEEEELREADSEQRK